MSEEPPQDVHAIARTLVEALPYMRRYNDATFVVKYGGHAMRPSSWATSPATSC